MTKKAINIGTKPRSTPSAETWVSQGGPERPATPPADTGNEGTTETEQTQPPKPPMKRLTLEIPADLHTAIKVSCAGRGVKMVEELRQLLEEHYRKTS